MSCTEVKGAVEGHITHKGPSSCDPKSSALFSTPEMVGGQVVMVFFQPPSFGLPSWWLTALWTPELN